MKHPATKQDAFSLVEVMFAVTILSIVIAGAFATIHTANMINMRSRNRALANELIQYEVENIRSMNWDQVDAISNRSSSIKLPDSLNEAYGEKYTVYREVKDLNSDQREIKLSAQWEDVHQNEQEIFTYITYSKEGMSDAYYRVYK